jgi:hypothetical protein
LPRKQSAAKPPRRPRRNDRYRAACGVRRLLRCSDGRLRWPASISSTRTAAPLGFVSANASGRSRPSDRCPAKQSAPLRDWRMPASVRWAKLAPGRPPSAKPRWWTVHSSRAARGVNGDRSDEAGIPHKSDAIDRPAFFPKMLYKACLAGLIECGGMSTAVEIYTALPYILPCTRSSKLRITCETPRTRVYPKTRWRPSFRSSLPTPGRAT